MPIQYTCINFGHTREKLTTTYGKKFEMCGFAV